MKGNKLLAVILAAMMAASSVSFPATALSLETVESVTNEAAFEEASLAEEAELADDETSTVFTVGAGQTYATLADAMTAAANVENITFEIYGKVELSFEGWLLDSLTKAKSVAFVGKDENAEIDLTAMAAIFGSNKADLKNVSYKDLKLSHSTHDWVGDYGHSTNYFTTWLRGAGKVGAVSYENCTFPYGSSNNQYGQTTYTNCEFAHNDGEYGLWIYYGATDDETKVTVEDSSFSGAKGVKLYSESTAGTGKTVIEDVTFTDITAKPAVVCSVAGTVELNNVTTTNCTYGLVAKELAAGRNTTFANITVDGEAPAYAAKSSKLWTSTAAYALAEGVLQAEIDEYNAMYGWYDESKTEYTIGNTTEYLGFVNIINGKASGIAQNYFRNKTVKLSADLDFSGIDFLKADADGNVTSDYRAIWFYGTFDGDGHTMKNINYTVEETTSNWGIGIFRNAAGATFKNVTVDGITVVSNSRISFGGLVSSASGKLNNIGNSFDNCHIKDIDVDVNATTGYNGNGGGLTGYLIDGSSIKDCSVEDFDFKASNGIIAFGGLCGYFIIDGAQQSIGEVTDCTVSNFKLEATKVGGRLQGAGGNFGGVGGLLGYGHDGNSMGLPIKNCHVTGLDMTITGGESEAYIGGFIGMTRRKYSVEDSSVTGKITASNAENNDRFFVGGFVGGAPGSDVNDAQSTSYTNCTADVDITVTGTTTAGGFAGISGNARLEGLQNSNYNNGRSAQYVNCTAMGTVHAEGVAGGFAGVADRGTYTLCNASATSVSGATAGGFIGSVERVGNGTGTGYKLTLDYCNGSSSASSFIGTQKTESIVVNIRQATGAACILRGSDINFYDTLPSALADAQDGETITLLADASGDGLQVEAGRFTTGLTLNLGGHTYTISGNAVGSNNTQTNGLKLLKDNVITIKNGTINAAETVTCDAASTSRPTQQTALGVLVQNYSSLTLDGVTLDARNCRKGTYALSNNFGTTTIKSNSTIIAPNSGFAFDVDGHNGGDSYGTVDVTVESGADIQGYVQISRTEGATLALNSAAGTYTEAGEYSYNKETGEFTRVERSIEAVASTNSVEAGDTVTITVKIHGEGLTNASYKLTYDTTKFAPVSGANTGVYDEILYLTDGDNLTWNDGDTLNTYKFKALAQTEEVTGTFTISDASAYNHEESIGANLAIKAKTNAVDVTITMKDYTATVLVDDVATTEDSATITYDGNAHTFVVVTDPSATVKYTVDGVAEDSVSVTNPGTYTIKYWTEQEANGYTALAEKTFTLTITNECDYVVEVSETADYVAGYKLVLVYTNTDNVTFEYGGKLMIDVTSRGYKYDGVSYNHVYAFVTPALDETFELDAYKDLIRCNIPGKDGLYTMPAYTTDLNFDGDMTVLDISTGYGIYNAIDTYMAEIKYQKNILRADTNGDKKVDTADTAAVVNAVKAATNTANNG